MTSFQPLAAKLCSGDVAAAGRSLAGGLMRRPGTANGGYAEL